MTHQYTLSDKGAQALKGEEGLRLTAYADSNGYMTIGYGHRVFDSKITCVTMEQAQAFFREDTARVVNELNSLPDNVSLTQDQVDALVSFIFNIGINAWRGSTARRDLVNGHIEAVPTEMMHWVHNSFGHTVLGLVARRNREAKRFIGAQAA